jgi:hypothetical protein
LIFQSKGCDESKVSRKEDIMDDRFHNYKDCRILGVYKRIRANVKLLNEFLIEIAINKEDSCFSDYINIKLGKSNLYEELHELMSGKRERVYAAYGMADIDIFKSERENKYCIEWSPNEASYNYYYFEKEDFEKDFIMAFMPDEEKEY